MNAVLFTAPILEPIDLASLKLHLRLDSGSFSGNIDETPSFHPASYAVADDWTTNYGEAIEVLGYTAVVNFQAGTNLPTGTVDMRIQDADVLGTWNTWGTDFTQVTAEGILTGAVLAIGTDQTHVANGAFTYYIAGVNYPGVVNPVGTDPGTDLVPQNKYGAIAFDIGIDGTIHAIPAAGNAAGYASAAAAILGIPAVIASHARMGTVTVISTAVAGFQFGTDAFNLGTATVVYTSAVAGAMVPDNASYEKAYTGTKRYIRTVAKVLRAACTFNTLVVRLTATSIEDDLLNAIITTAREHVEDITRRGLLTQTWEYYLDEWPSSNRIKIPFGNLQTVTHITWKDTDGVETNLTKTLTAFAASDISPATKTKVTSAAHEFADGDSVFISGTTSYNGIWIISNVTTNTFDIIIVFVANDATGTATTDYIIETNGDQCGFIVLPYGGTWPSGTLFPSNPIVIRFICGWTTAALVPYKIKAACKMIAAKLYESRGEDVLGQTVHEDQTVQRLLASARLWDEFG